MSTGVNRAEAAESPEAAPAPSRAEYLRLAEEVETNLESQILDKFFPAAADEHGGGFFEDFALDWSRLPGDRKSVVYQSRLTWTSAEAARRFPARASLYLAMTRQGAAFLEQQLWDRSGGGFFWTVDGRGGHAPVKEMYGHAFGIYALAANYRVTKDAAALDLAKRAFWWMEHHAHDDSQLGYFERVGPDGKPVLEGPANVVGARAGQKSMNTSIHILEALTGLDGVWPDPVVKKRVREMLSLCQTRIYCDPGYLHQFFSADWKPTLSSDSFGHDVETGFLMVEAAEALRERNEEPYWGAARHLVDHALQCGWDAARGGLYDSAPINQEGVITGQPRTEKIWWVQAEQLNSLLLLHQHYGGQTRRYWDAFVKQWHWIQRSQVDPVHGGWWATVRADGMPISRVKADMWTECYHQARATLRVSQRLRALAAKASGPAPGQ